MAQLLDRSHSRACDSPIHVLIEENSRKFDILISFYDAAADINLWGNVMFGTQNSLKPFSVGSHKVVCKSINDKVRLLSKNPGSFS